MYVSVYVSILNEENFISFFREMFGFPEYPWGKTLTIIRRLIARTRARFSDLRVNSILPQTDLEPPRGLG